MFGTKDYTLKICDFTLRFYENYFLRFAAQVERRPNFFTRIKVQFIISKLECRGKLLIYSFLINAITKKIEAKIFTLITKTKEIQFNYKIPFNKNVSFQEQSNPNQ